ncbi:hypothetical protein HYFRA_00007411 [Hymenoscyphus fraxineus]|uniref:Uncharacterized protein n=1 Tax=Hymenoscyphus fraxineus TaxID=746836 RepID=A0A9N9KSU3_9HELO|nr:hypothetical protein HYFRA_00007411 [Hymenoscyphus fraxineus]
MSGPMAISKFGLNGKSRETLSITPTSSPWSPSISIDLEKQHISLRQFGEGIKEAVKAVFPTENNAPRYLKATVLIFVWADDHPDLPALDHLDRLSRVFHDVYNFEVETFKIPKQNPHSEVNQKIRSFARQGENNRGYLKIVFYAGCSRVTSNGALLWTSVLNSEEKETPGETPRLMWSEIQPFLERSQNDVLLLLDCYTSGGIVGEGNGVTEIMSAGAFDSAPNTGRSCSFTHALATGLEAMGRSRRNASFSVGELYSHIYKSVWNNMTGDINDRHAYPTHHVLTQEIPRRSIHISLPPPKSLHPTHGTSGHTNRLSYMRSRESMLNSRISTAPRKFVGAEGSPYRVPTTYDGEVSRLAFAIRLENNSQNNRISQALFDDWFKHVPLSEKLKVEAAFNSVSSLLIISVPISISAYVPTSPGIIPLGPIRSSNLLITPLTLESSTKHQQDHSLPAIITSRDEPTYNNSLFQPPPTPQDDYESMCSSSFSSLSSDMFNPYSGFKSDEFLDLDDDQTQTSTMTSYRKYQYSPTLPEIERFDTSTQESTVGLGLEFSAPDKSELSVKASQKQRRAKSKKSLRPKLGLINTSEKRRRENPDDLYDPQELSSWLTSHLTKPPPEDTETDALPDLETIAQAFTPLPSIQKFTIDESRLQTPTLSSFPLALPSPKRVVETDVFSPERAQFPLNSSHPLPIPPSPSEIFKSLIKTPQGRRVSVQAFYDPSMIHCWTSPEFIDEFGFQTKKIASSENGREYEGLAEGLGYDLRTGVLMPEYTVEIQCKILVNGREAWGNVVFNVCHLVEGSCLVFGRGFESAGVEVFMMSGW